MQEKISQKIQEIRESNELNYSEMGKLLGLSHTAIIKLEQGKSLPAVPTLWKLWRVFGIAPEVLIALYEDKPKNTTRAARSPGNPENLKSRYKRQ